MQVFSILRSLNAVPVKICGYIALGLVLVLCSVAGKSHLWHGSPQFHAGLETIAILLALITGTIALVRFYSRKEKIFLLIGAGFLGAAFLDGYHAVVTSQLLSVYMPSDLTSLIPWSWIASRQYLSILLLLSFIGWWSESRHRVSTWISERSIYAFAICYTVASFAFFMFVPLPAGYLVGTLFARPVEFLPALFFFAALVGYFYKGNWRHDAFEYWLVMSLIVSVIAQSTFMPFSTQLFDFEFDASHFLKIVSYSFVLVGLIVNMHVTFKSEDQNDKALLVAKDGAEAALAELNSHRLAIDQHCIVQAMDLDFKIAYVNDRFCEILKCQPDEYIGWTDEILSCGYHPRSYFDDMWDVVRTGVPWHGEVNVSARDGSEVWLDTTIVPLTDEKNRIDRYISIRTDITKRKTAEMKNRKNLDLLNATFEGFPGGMSAFNQNLEMIMVNPKFYEVMGVTEKQFPLGSRFDDLIRYSGERGDEGGIADIDKMVRERVELFLSAKAYSFEKGLFDGRTLCVTGDPLATGGFINTYVDITERKKTETLMAQQAASMKLMNSIAVAANHMTDPQEVMDFGMNSIGEFTGWDVGIVYLVAEGGQELIQPPNIIYETEPDLYRNFKKRLVDAGVKSEVSLPGRALKMGSLEWVGDMSLEVNLPSALIASKSGLTGAVAMPVRVDDEIAAIIGFMSKQKIEPSSYLFELLAHVAQQIARVMERARTKQDLIEHSDQLSVEVQNATRELQEKAAVLEEALTKEKALNELQREFVSMVSHQFHTPLAIIDSSAQLLVGGSNSSRDTVTKRVDKIRRAVKRMTTLMASTLSAASFDAGKVNISLGVCGLVDVIKETCIRQMEVSQNHEIISDLDDLPSEILGDPAALDQVFTNLLSNAVKYSPEGGPIHVKGWCEGDMIHVSVADRGIGIDEEDIPQMFNRFFRAKTAAGVAGTGIGLNIVKLFIEGHGGEIKVASEKGQGSIFTVSLPISGQALKAQDQTAA